MNIVVIDTLIQTIDFKEPVRNGLVRSAMMDVEALCLRHDVHFLYYGKKPDSTCKWKPLIIGDLGVKDYCILENTDRKYSFLKIRKDLPVILNLLKSVKPIHGFIIHVFMNSKYLERIAREFPGVPKLFIFHDKVYNNNIFSLATMLKLMTALKKYPGSRILTNSDYTRQGIISLYKSRYRDIMDIFSGAPVSDPLSCFDHVFRHFAFYSSPKKAQVVGNKDFSVNIGRYTRKKGIPYLFGLPAYGNFKIKLFGQTDEIFDRELKFFHRLQKYIRRYPEHFQLCRNYSTGDLFTEAKSGKNLIITCPVEGFGFTAFEMGKFGLPVVILKNGELHATEEYLNRIGASYLSVNLSEKTGYKKQLYEAITSLELTKQEKALNAKRYLNYFTLANYVKEREDLLNNVS